MIPWRPIAELSAPVARRRYLLLRDGISLPFVGVWTEAWQAVDPLTGNLRPIYAKIVSFCELEESYV